MTSLSDAPLVSAITTAYNSGSYIHRALDSLLTQTYPNIECIVVNDGSQDGTGEVIDEYAARDPRVRAFHRQNGGPSRAGNTALANARGKYIAVLDHDDMAVPDRFEKQVAYLETHASVGVIGGAMVTIDQRDIKLRRYSFPTAPADVRAWMFRAPTINHSSTMMRRELVDRVGGYRHAFAVVPDVDLFLRLSDHAELATLPDVVVYYRIHQGRLTARLHPRQLVMNEVAIALAHSRVRGRKDDIPEDLYVDASTLDQLALDAAQLERLRPLFVTPPPPG